MVISEDSRAGVFLIAKACEALRSSFFDGGPVNSLSFVLGLFF